MWSVLRRIHRVAVGSAAPARAVARLLRVGLRSSRSPEVLDVGWGYGRDIQMLSSPG